MSRNFTEHSPEQLLLTGPLDLLHRDRDSGSDDDDDDDDLDLEDLIAIKRIRRFRTQHTHNATEGMLWTGNRLGSICCATRDVINMLAGKSMIRPSDGMEQPKRIAASDVMPLQMDAQTNSSVKICHELQTNQPEASNISTRAPEISRACICIPYSVSSSRYGVLQSRENRSLSFVQSDERVESAEAPCDATSAPQLLPAGYYPDVMTREVQKGNFKREAKNLSDRTYSRRRRALQRAASPFVPNGQSNTLTDIPYSNRIVSYDRIKGEKSSVGTDLELRKRKRRDMPPPPSKLRGVTEHTQKGRKQLAISDDKHKIKLHQANHEGFRIPSLTSVSPCHKAIDDDGFKTDLEAEAELIPVSIYKKLYTTEESADDRSRLHQALKLKYSVCQNTLEGVRRTRLLGRAESRILEERARPIASSLAASISRHDNLSLNLITDDLTTWEEALEVEAIVQKRYVYRSLLNALSGCQGAAGLRPVPSLYT